MGGKGDCCFHFAPEHAIHEGRRVKGGGSGASVVLHPDSSKIVFYWRKKTGRTLPANRREKKGGRMLMESGQGKKVSCQLKPAV